MKTKLTTIFKKSANTPPMWVCLLFALLISANSWASVTAEWGDWVSPKKAFPSSDSQSTIEGDINISLTSTQDAEEGLYLGWDNNPTSTPTQNWRNSAYAFGEGYVDISLSSGVLVEVSAYVWLDVKIRFCSQASYNDDLAGDPKSFTGYNQSSATLSTISAPENAKSARIYSSSGGYLYRLIVTAQSEDCPKLTASFSTGTGSGTAPDNIEKCEGASFTMPGKGSMTKAGYALIGWKKDNAGDLIAVGQNYTMPAGGVSFTAQWEEIPAVSMPADSVKVHGTDFEVSWVIPGICDLKKPVKAT